MSKVKLNLMSHELRGVVYGVGRCNVLVGPGTLDAVAVAAGDDRWVSTEEDCIEWLAQHGMNDFEARGFVRNGLRAWDEAHSIGQA